MQVETSRFGTIEIQESEIIAFPWGIPGFEELKKFVLLNYKEGPFQWLQSTEEPTVAFVVCTPELLGIAYNIPEDKLAPLKLEKSDDLLVLNIVSFDREQNVIRFHMRGPLLFNSATRVAYQWTMGPEDVLENVAIPSGLAWTEDAEGPAK